MFSFWAIICAEILILFSPESKQHKVIKTVLVLQIVELVALVLGASDNLLLLQDHNNVSISFLATV